MTIKPYIEPKDRLPYAVRMRNRAIAIFVFILICFGIGSCIFGGSSKDSDAAPAEAEEIVKDSAVANESNVAEAAPTAEVSEQIPENVSQEQPAEIAAANDSAQTIAPVEEIIDSTHIKSQKDVFMAEKIDNLLRRFKPENAIILIVDPRSNEILAWGERKDNVIQTKPDYLIRNTFPAASLAKTITIAAAMESNRYALNTPIPQIGGGHTLYKNQLRVKENYSGPTVEMQDAYGKSYNPPLALIGMNVGASRLKAAAKILGYNMNYPAGLPGRSTYAPPDTGYALAEASCGFTEATTLSPLQAAAQVRAILLKKPLEIPWSSNLDGIAPKTRLALDVGKFSENTYYGLRQAMIRSVTHGTAKKNISTKHMARKNYEALNIGGKTGSLDGSDPKGRYDWFMGFAESKEDPSKAIVIVVLQIFDNQGLRPQPTTQVTGMLINYWAHQYVTNKKK
ncbi:MAG: penicillin-binding protein [Fibrobacter sp.]|nr:penicillin-binding protein [Fibrobacter sp.]